MLLQHDVRPTLVLHFRCSSTGLEVAPYPPNNPDLAPSDFRLSAALNRHLEGLHCTCDEDDQAEKRKWFPEEPEGFYSDEFKKLVKRWRCRAELEADYAEK